MSVKHEWRKKEKALYLPKAKPELLDLPDLQFITIHGEGSPAQELFSELIGTLYSLAYGIKMLPKKMEVKPQGHFDFTVYPLEGVWDINEQAKKVFDGTVNKVDFVYELMIRQPEFVTYDFYTEIFEIVKNKKSNPLLDKVEFKTVSEGRCIQMLHLGSYDDEPATFQQMEEYAESQGVSRVSKVHREIYQSDARKTPPEKLKTVLRFQVQ
ncbi:GyrI-like domain-containing protein [Paraglaciecola sp.]|uniref:GyrI-like domain-containing protein n=1 Tax=Paraglaciecola sp. TaxID=1920173 RepID=UPI003EF7F6EC